MYLAQPSHWLVLDWKFQAVEAENAGPLNVMIAGAPASGKGTQCELIKAKVSEFGIQPCKMIPFASRCIM
jgi:pantothenate kinase